MRKRAFAAVWCFAVASVLPADVHGDDFESKRLVNWHQWRGPLATGVAPQASPPVRWDERTNVKWKGPVPGRGTSTPIVWGDRIFLLTAIETERRAGKDPVEPEPGGRDAVDAKSRGKKKAAPPNIHRFVVLCLERSTGRILWERTAAEVAPHERHHNTSSFVAASPVTDGRRVYCSFGSRGVYCYDLDGGLRWKADLGRLNIKFQFGEGSSPALHGDSLIVNCDHEGQSFIAALDARTGREKWRAPRDEKTTWNTPLAVEFGGRVQVIVNGAKIARSYDLATGELIWKHDGPPGVDAIPSAVALDDRVICMSGFRRNPAYAVRLSSKGEVSEDELAWKHGTGGTPQISTPVLVGERLFFTKDRIGVMTCLNARTGDAIMTQERLPLQGDIYPSPVAAAGRVYFTARNGGTTVIDAGASELRVLAENKIDETVVGSPAMVGAEIFIRGDRHLFCIAEGG